MKVYYLPLKNFRLVIKIFLFLFFSVGDEAVRAGIARVEKLLAQGNDHSHQPPPPPNHHAAGTANAATSDVSEENSKDVHAPSMTSSDQVQLIIIIIMLF